MRDGKMADNIVEPCESNPPGSVNDLSEETKKEADEFKEKANEYFKSGCWNYDTVGLFVKMHATFSLDSRSTGLAWQRRAQAWN